MPVSNASEWPNTPDLHLPHHRSNDPTAASGGSKTTQDTDPRRTLIYGAPDHQQRTLVIPTYTADINWWLAFMNCAIIPFSRRRGGCSWLQLFLRCVICWRATLLLMCCCSFRMSTAFLCGTISGGSCHNRQQLVVAMAAAAKGSGSISVKVKHSTRNPVDTYQVCAGTRRSKATSRSLPRSEGAGEKNLYGGAKKVQLDCQQQTKTQQSSCNSAARGGNTRSLPPLP